jgi:type IV pilus assembly protein PilM
MAVLSTLQKLFPPPTYITLPSIGIDISDTSLKYIGFKRAHPRDTDLTLTHWGDIAIPEGVVDRGNVHQGVLANVLREVKNQTKAEYVTVSLPEERAYLFETTIPIITPRKEMRQFLELKLEENVPLSPRDAYFDFVIVGKDEETNDLRAAVSVYARDTINNYYDACIAAELIPLAFEIEAQAIARASIPHDQEDAYMMVDFGKTRMGIGIVYKGTLMYTSTIDIAGQQLSAAMRHVLGGEKSEAELTQIKNTKGIIATPDNLEVAHALEEITKNMAEELSVRMHYWHTRKIDRGERQIKKILLCGGSSNLWGFPEYLSEALKVPTERARVWQNAFSLDAFVPPITRKYSYGYATAIGLALRSFSRTS